MKITKLDPFGIQIENFNLDSDGSKLEELVWKNGFVVLKKLDAKELYKQIKRLIKNTKLRKKIQTGGFEHIKHLVKVNTVLIDKIRDSLVQNFSLNYL